MSQTHVVFSRTERHKQTFVQSKQQIQQEFDSVTRCLLTQTSHNPSAPSPWPEGGEHVSKRGGREEERREVTKKTTRCESWRVSAAILWWQPVTTGKRYICWSSYNFNICLFFPFCCLKKIISVLFSVWEVTHVVWLLFTFHRFPQLLHNTKVVMGSSALRVCTCDTHRRGPGRHNEAFSSLLDGVCVRVCVCTCVYVQLFPWHLLHTNMSVSVPPTLDSWCSLMDSLVRASLICFSSALAISCARAHTHTKTHTSQLSGFNKTTNIDES